ncbi:MAG: zinc metallopeptidase [Pseudomonadales bacterium]|nr:zinc metallopeptidase [Pseudomonadales bacterium]
MLIILLIIFVLATIILPGIWATHILAKYQLTDDSLQGTGGELAQHLIERFALTETKIELTNLGDHYDPAEKMVRLSEANMDGQSLTAVATAVHEIGHALQHQQGYRPLLWRSRLVKVALIMEKVGSFSMMLSPVMVIVTKSPFIGGLLFGVAILSMLILSIVHFVTLPVEFNASFGRALPILKEGYISSEQYKITEKILLACTLTYLAQSLSSLLNLGRWLAVFRR